MANIKINGMVLAAVSASMQLETDIGGVTPNKITISGLQTYLDANLSFAAVSHSHSLADISAITSDKLIGDADGAGTVGEIGLSPELSLTTGTLSVIFSGGQTF